MMREQRRFIYRESSMSDWVVLSGNVAYVKVRRYLVRMKERHYKESYQLDRSMMSVQQQRPSPPPSSHFLRDCQESGEQRQATQQLQPSFSAYSRHCEESHQLVRATTFVHQHRPSPQQRQSPGSAQSGHRPFVEIDVNTKSRNFVQEKQPSPKRVHVVRDFQESGQQRQAMQQRLLPGFPQFGHFFSKELDAVSALSILRSLPQKKEVVAAVVEKRSTH
jgi:hypothetical protein